ncbi:MAG TPA: transcriptional repressor LexA [Thermoanaerobacterales bacterium]|jgi:repressor LexA|nr:transcriptional repressor LexA [Thermoanaerobacterales bacterium]
MYEDLTPRQKQILDFIECYITENGYPPSVREIGAATKLKSTSTVHAYLTQLEKKGYLNRNPQTPRAIEVVNRTKSKKGTVEVPLVGKVTAGEPILAQQNIENIVLLPREMVPDSDVFMLSVKGDSMIEAGILDGDYVIVQVCSTAENGDIVVALIGDEATIKRFYKEKSYFRLQPENKFMEPIMVKELNILGKVVGLLRRFS